MNYHHHAVRNSYGSGTLLGLIEREGQCDYFDNYDISYNNDSVLGTTKKSQFQN